MKPMLDPERDLAGATPKTLARALFRRVKPLRPSARVEPVVCDEVSVEKDSVGHPADGVTHLSQRS